MRAAAGMIWARRLPRIIWSSTATPFWRAASGRIITALPVAKRESHRLALRDAATSGEARFFLGTDSAPHPDSAKLQPCGCAGCFTAPNTMSILAHVFEEENALDRLEAFASLNGAAFYGLPANADRIRLVKRDTPADYPATINAGDETVTVFDPGHPLYWHLEDA